MRAAGANRARLVDTMAELIEHVMTTDGTLQAMVAARVADVAVAHGTSLLHARECVQLHSAHVRCVMRQLSCGGHSLSAAPRCCLCCSRQRPRPQQALRLPSDSLRAMVRVS